MQMRKETTAKSCIWEAKCWKNEYNILEANFLKIAEKEYCILDATTFVFYIKKQSQKRK